MSNKHNIKWFAVFNDGSTMSREKSMSDSGFGWDVVCSCGWQSRTGGAIASCVRRMAKEHREYAWIDELTSEQLRALANKSNVAEALA